jgi:hypothetical protein
MALKLTLFLLTFFLAFGAWAQGNFARGYYITPQRDTVHGYISYQSEAYNNIAFNFKKNLKDSRPTRFTSEMSEGFVVENKDFYEKHTFVDFKGITHTGFFKVLLRADLSLLRFNRKYFAKSKGDTLHQVSNHAERINGRRVVLYSGRGWLEALMLNCEVIGPKYLDLQYAAGPDYLGIFTLYNECIGSSIVKSQKVKFRTHATVGVIGSYFDATVMLRKLHTTMDQLRAPGAGVTTSIFIPGTRNFGTFAVEAIYGHGEGYAYLSQSNANTDLFISYSHLRTPILARVDVGKLFIEGGFVGQFMLSQKATERSEIMYPNMVVTEEIVAAPFQNFTSGLLLGVGFQNYVLDRPVRMSFRYSQTETKNAPYLERFRTLELTLSVMLTN